MDLLRTILRMTCLCVGVLSMMLGGGSLIFSIYTNALKKTYNYTQSELEIMSAVGNIGFSVGCLPGILIEKFGPRSASLAALILTSGGYMLLWSATKMKLTYHKLSAVQCIYFFIAYSGGVFSYMAAIVPNIVNFKPRYRGTIVSILDGGLSAGAAILVALYGGLFVHGHVTDEENQDVEGFFLTMAITSAVINGLGVIFLGYYSHVEDLDTNTEQQKLVNEPRDQAPEVDDVTGCALVKNWDYQFLAWMFVFQSSSQLMFVTNVSVYLKSFSMEDQDTIFNVLIPTSGVLAKLLCGILSDLLVRYISRPVILLVSNIAQTVVYLLLILYASNFYCLLIITIVTGLANGAIWSLTPTLMSEYFGTKYFGRNWGLSLMGNAVGGIVIQKAFGAIYEAEVTGVGETFCYGEKCFRWSSVMVTVISLCTVIFNIGLVERRRRVDKVVLMKDSGSD